MYQAGRRAVREPVRLPLPECDGTTLAVALQSPSDVPAVPTSAVDGWAGRGPQPWQPIGRVLAGEHAARLDREGVCVEIATGAMVPAGTESVIRRECARQDSAGITGEARARRDWRDPGEEVRAGDVLLPAGVAVTPSVIGLAAACGHDGLHVRKAPSAAVLVLGGELEVAGLPAPGRIRDALGPSLPSWLRRLGALPTHGDVLPVPDTLDAHHRALTTALADADIVCTTGGTMHGPADHVRAALELLGARLIVDTVAVRPGAPMFAASLPGDRFVCGLPGNPQAALVALMTLLPPLLAGLAHQAPPPTWFAPAGETFQAHGTRSRLAPVAFDDHGRARTLGHVGSAMLRGVTAADGFVVIPPGEHIPVGQDMVFLPLPLRPGESPRGSYDDPSPDRTPPTRAAVPRRPPPP
jgi:molybdopterin molybdotransferase